MRNLVLGTSVAACLSLGLGIAHAAHTDATPALHRGSVTPAVSRDDSPRRYIVRLRESPAATYTGGVAGYAATDARVYGERILDVPAAASYAAYLDERQSSVLASAAKLLGRRLLPRYRYHLALNGMSVQLTPTEAIRLATLPGVLSVHEVQRFAPTTSVAQPASAGDTNASRAWINAPVVWQLPSNGTDNEGEGVVLAELDTGINDQNSSFAATGQLDGYIAQDPNALRFGVCDPNNTKQHAYSTPLTCNDKLIGAYSYTHGSNDPDSPEDSEGHGSHTASTAVGDFTTTTVNGASTSLSGVAPHASLIAYDVCDPTDLCSEDDSVAAVEQAIKDQATLKKNWTTAFMGMVLNFSIGGSDSPYDDPVEQAFLSAAEAGIYVSAAAGNGGPENVSANNSTTNPVYPVQHLGAWVATLAAATHDGSFTSNELETFSGGDASTMPTAAMVGDGDTGPFGPEPLVYTGSGNYNADYHVKSGKAPTSGTAYPSSQGAAADTDQCLFPFDAGTFNSNEIVVCDRGTNPLVDKAYNVQQGGAAGMVIATTSTSSQDMVVEPYVIPASLLDLKDGNKLRAWLNASAFGAPMAQLSGSTLTTDRSQADQIAGFSSRGPVVDGDYNSIIKPDLAAPGVSVLAAVSNPLYTDGCNSCADAPETFDFYDGTSMATPHDTGAAALLMQAHPSWSVSEIKSALMLTAVTSKNGTSPGVTDQCASLDSGNNCVASKALPSPQVRGSGRIDVDAAERTGLVLDESGADYAAADPSKGGDLTTLNLASLGNAACTGTCTWTRTVTSTFSSARVTYSVSVSGQSTGLQLSVSPTSFTLAPGATQVLTVTANASQVTVSDWAFGEVDLSTSDSGDGGAAIPDMHLPVAVENLGSSSSGGSGSGNGSSKSSGGGGDLGLFGLASLLLAWRRRSAR